MWTLEYSKEAKRDFELIFDHLFSSYVELGDPVEDAVERAAGRLAKLRIGIGKLVDTPYIGTLRPDIHPEIRFLRRDNAAVWFLPIEDRRRIEIIAIFYGAQNHVRRMLARMLDH